VAGDLSFETGELLDVRQRVIEFLFTRGLTAHGSPVIFDIQLLAHRIGAGLTSQVGEVLF
jgi:hypothetical protein